MAKKKKEPPRERLFTTDEMAKILQVEKRVLVEWVQYRRIPHVIIDGRNVRFKLSDIAKWVRDKNRTSDRAHIS
ncbi:MAG: helix-turn-helix domain-containing protein [bacterium]